MLFFLLLSVSFVFSQEACENKAENKDPSVTPIKTGDVAEMCQRVVDQLKKCLPKTKPEEDDPLGLVTTLVGTLKIMEDYEERVKTLFEFQEDGDKAVVVGRCVLTAARSRGVNLPFPTTYSFWCKEFEAHPDILTKAMDHLKDDSCGSKEDLAVLAVVGAGVASQVSAGYLAELTKLGDFKEEMHKCFAAERKRY